MPLAGSLNKFHISNAVQCCVRCTSSSKFRVKQGKHVWIGASVVNLPANRLGGADGRIDLGVSEMISIEGYAGAHSGARGGR